MSLLYRSDVFKTAGQPNTTTRTSLLKLNQLFQRTNIITVRIMFPIYTSDYLE